MDKVAAIIEKTFNNYKTKLCKELQLDELKTLEELRINVIKSP